MAGVFRQVWLEKGLSNHKNIDWQEEDWRKTRPFKIKHGRIYWRDRPIDDDDFQMNPHAIAEYREFMKKHGKRILRRVNRRKRKRY